MFNPDVVGKKKVRAAIHLIANSPLSQKGVPLFGPGFTLQEHSIGEVEQANKHLRELLKDDGSLVREFTIEEKRWIINEQTLCSISFPYWASRYAYIIDWMNQLVRFVPNTAQSIVLDVMSKHEAAGMALLFQVLKARQLGITTLAELILLWRTIFHPWSNTLVASSRPDKSEAMVKKMTVCFENQPYWLVPKVTSHKAGEKISFDGQKSYINIRHGAMLSDIGRGDTLSGFHLSEVIEYLNPDEAIDSSLLRAAHDNPTLIGFLESTANGRSGWWYTTWLYIKEYWPKGEARLCPIFLPWYIGTDLYPTATWLRAHPVPEGWDPPEMARDHAKRATEYIRSGQNPVATVALGEDWEMPLYQVWYWHVSRQEYAAKGKLHLWYQEMPADDMEAFQSANPSVFEAELVYSLREKSPPPVGVYGIQAPLSEIPLLLQAKDRDIDRSQPPIEIVANWNPTGKPHRYTLYPLLHHGTAPFSPAGKLIMYERPSLKEIYGVGIDCGFGVGKDNSAIEVIRKGSYTRGAAQVAEWAAANVNSLTLWPFAHAIGTLYASLHDGRLRQSKMVIEGAANGEMVYNELKKRGWREFHNWVRYDRKRQLETKMNRQLWYTVSWSRPLLMDMLLDAINKGWLEVRSPWFIDEMADLEMDFVKMRIAAAGGKHDDRIMAMGMVLFSMHALETKYLDRWTSRPGAEEEGGITPYPAFSPGTQGNDHSERVNDSTVSYTYKVIRASDPLHATLEEGGASLYSPK